MTAIVRVESGGDPLIMFDNSTARQYRPATRKQATSILNRLLARGDQVDAGIAQVDSENFAHYGLNTTTVFDACTNLNAGARIFESGYRMSVRAGYAGQSAEYHAFEAYNSGKLFGDARYADAVFRAAGMPVFIHISPGSSGLRLNNLTYRTVPSSEYDAPFASAWSTPSRQKRNSNNWGMKWASLPEYQK